LEARQKDILDIEMTNKISQINPDFKEFLMRIKADLNSMVLFLTWVLA
jgi:hypothetical protein